jgi:hypothetical protein
VRGERGVPISYNSTIAPYFDAFGESQCANEVGCVLRLAKRMMNLRPGRPMIACHCQATGISQRRHAANSRTLAISPLLVIIRDADLNSSSPPEPHPSYPSASSRDTVFSPRLHHSIAETMRH